MPVIKSAKKDIRQATKRRERNLERKNKIKNLTKQAKALLPEKKEEAIKMLPEIYKAIDKAAKQGTIKKNTASRKKSVITKMIQK